MTEGTPLLRALTRVRSAVGIVFLSAFTALLSLPTMLFGLLGWIEFGTWATRFWAKVILATFGIRIQVRGEENLPKEGGGIIVFNHQSHFDIPVLALSSSKHIRFGAKIELFRIPFFGMGMRAIGTLPIARDDRAGVLKIYKDAAVRFKRNFLFALAPEGTRQAEPQIGRFKKGPFVFAINAGVPILPVVIKGTFDVLPRKKLRVNVGRWSRTIQVEFLAPISTQGVDLSELGNVTLKVHDLMVDVFEKLPLDV